MESSARITGILIDTTIPHLKKWSFKYITDQGVTKKLNKGRTQVRRLYHSSEQKTIPLQKMQKKTIMSTGRFNHITPGSTKNNEKNTKSHGKSFSDFFRLFPILVDAY